MRNLIILCLLLSGSLAHAASSDKNPEQTKILSRTSVRIAFLHDVFGELWANENGFVFIPSQSCYGIGVMDKLFACHNDMLVGQKEFNYSDIRKIARRSSLLIIPNRFVIIMNDGSRYKCFSYNRGRVIRLFEEKRS